MGRREELLRRLMGRPASRPQVAISTPANVRRLAAEAARAGMPGGPPMRNLVHDRPAIQYGAPGPLDHLTEQGWIYRTLTEPELADARSIGFFLPPASGRSRGGGVNVKHWVRGGSGEPVQFFRANMGKQVVRVPEGLLLPDAPVRATDALLATPGWDWIPVGQ